MPNVSDRATEMNLHLKSEFFNRRQQKSGKSQMGGTRGQLASQNHVHQGKKTNLSLYENLGAAKNLVTLSTRMHDYQRDLTKHFKEGLPSEPIVETKKHDFLSLTTANKKGGND